ncbi:hypothetical protein VitviT2T_020390 [Vitis vinifera]|uniref:Uncharacterized protein n=1 Tax=Vitis vinifera TaxID=29760 RepID=A0ABY9D478_VITVI|nr:hypothetical protein VitviT2T_020390 [Vitis vinifera]
MMASMATTKGMGWFRWSAVPDSSSPSQRLAPQAVHPPVGSRKNSDTLVLSANQETGSTSLECHATSVDEDEDGGISDGEKVTARFNSSSAETVTEVVEEKSDIFLGKRISQSGSKDIVPDVVDTSDPIQTMFSDNRSELCWAMSSELQKFTVGIETQLVEEIPGTGQHLTSWESTLTKAIFGKFATSAATYPESRC